MDKLLRSVKLIVQISFVVIMFFVVLYISVLQNRSIGQTYQRIIFNGDELCCVRNDIDIEYILLQEKRALALQSNMPLRMEYSLSIEPADKWFVLFATEEELSALLGQKLRESVLDAEDFGYTIAIEEYHANFGSIEDIISFLEEVKSESDPEGQFIPEISKEKGHIAGILMANLVETKTTESAETALAAATDKLVTGVNEVLMCQAVSAPAGASMGDVQDDPYQIGLLDMEFIENIEIYGHDIASEGRSDIREAASEVTKEKETNKIYVVESGDCLSVIALNFETTVASIVALNVLENENVTIHPGDELIVAVPEPDLRLRIQTGVVYEEDYKEDPVILLNDSWYTTQQVIHEEGTTGRRERNDVITYENGIEVGREMVYENILVASIPAVIEKGTVTPPTYIKPLAGGTKTSDFGYRWGRLHKGVDFACPIGTKLYASSAGTVVSAGYNNGYGYNVLLSHPDGKMTRYAHCSKLLVSAGDTVEQGETIALSGNTGRSTGPHVHFEIYVNGVAVNPLNYISY